MIRLPLLAAALFAAMPVNAAPLTASVDAGAFDFDSSLDELSGFGVDVTGGDLAGSLLTLFFVIGDPAFSTMEIDGVLGTPVDVVSETPASLTLSSLLDLDMDLSTPDDLVELTITGFAFNLNVTEALSLVPEGVFAAANTVQPIPLPAAAWMLGGGLAALAGLRASRRPRTTA